MMNIEIIMYDDLAILLWWNTIKNNSNPSTPKSVTTAPRFGTWGPYSRCNHSNLSHARNHSNPSLTHHSNHLHLPQKYKVPFTRFARFRGLIKKKWALGTLGAQIGYTPRKYTSPPFLILEIEIKILQKRKPSSDKCVPHFWVNHWKWMFILTQPAGQHLTEHFYIKSQLTLNFQKIIFSGGSRPGCLAPLIGISSKVPLHDIIKA